MMIILYMYKKIIFNFIGKRRHNNYSEKKMNVVIPVDNTPVNRKG